MNGRFLGMNGHFSEFLNNTCHYLFYFCVSFDFCNHKKILLIYRYTNNNDTKGGNLTKKFIFLFLVQTICHFQ